MNDRPPDPKLSAAYADAAWRTIQRVPREAGGLVFMRHAERPPIPKGEIGFDLQLTDAGAASARQLGELLRPRLRRVKTSPVHRCQLTAAALVADAAPPLSPIVVPHLGEPGMFVLDGELAWPQFLEHGVQLMAYRLSRREALPGFRTADDGVAFLIGEPLTELPPAGSLDVHVTHDYILAIAATLLLGRESEWPDFLDCLCVWRDPDGLAFSFRDAVGRVPPELVALLGRDPAR